MVSGYCGRAWCYRDPCEQCATVDRAAEARAEHSWAREHNDLPAYHAAVTAGNTPRERAS